MFKLLIKQINSKYMKLIFVPGLCVILIFSIIFISSHKKTGPIEEVPNNLLKEYKEYSLEKKQNIQVTNYGIWYTADAMSIENPTELESRYDAIIEHFNLQVLNDDTKNFISQKLDFLKELALNKEERKVLEEEIKLLKTSAIFKSLSRVNASISSTIDLSTPQGQIQFISNISTALFSAVMNFGTVHNELKIKKLINDWNVRCKEMETKHQAALNDLDHFYKQKDLIPEKQRVDRYKAKYLLKRINGNDSLHEKIRYLETIRESYLYFPIYWYYRGKYTYEYYIYQKDKNKQEYKDVLNAAKQCFEYFQILTENQVTKNDPIVLEVAMRQIGVELQQNQRNADKEFIKKQLAIIEGNIYNADDSFFDECFFCAEVYFYILEDYKKACEMFKKTSVKISNKDFEEEFKNIQKNKTLTITEDKNNNKNKCVYIKNKKIILPNSEFYFIVKAKEYYTAIHSRKADTVVMTDVKADCNINMNPLTTCFFSAYVTEEENKKYYYEEIFPEILGVQTPIDLKNYNMNNYIGEKPLPYKVKYLKYNSKWWATDEFYLELPFSCIKLPSISYKLFLSNKSENIKEFVECDKIQLFYDEETKDWKIRVIFKLEEDEIPNETKNFVFRLEHKLFTFNITFDISNRNNSEHDEEWYKNREGSITYSLSPEAAKYRDKIKNK